MTPREQAMEALRTARWAFERHNKHMEQKCLDALRALRDEAIAPPQEGWRSMESAPKDGTHILVASGKFNEHWTFNQSPPTVVHWFDPKEDGEAGFYLSHNAGDDSPRNYTHWRPLPAPPTDAEGVRDERNASRCFNEAQPAMTAPRVTEEMVEGTDTYPKPEHGWTCFHCGETFTTIGGARDHFGGMPDAKPGCMIRVQLGDERGLQMALREAEAELARYRADIAQIEAAAYERGAVAMRERAAKAADNCYDCYGRNAVADIRALTPKPEDQA